MSGRLHNSGATSPSISLSKRFLAKSRWFKIIECCSDQIPCKFIHFVCKFQDCWAGRSRCLMGASMKLYTSQLPKVRSASEFSLFKVLAPVLPRICLDFPGYGIVILLFSQATAMQTSCLHAPIPISLVNQRLYLIWWKVQM
jgi:hypothetical protein